MTGWTNGNTLSVILSNVLIILFVCLFVSLPSICFLTIGNYIYFESSSPVETGQNARILSKSFPKTSGRCMSFWFYMYGDGMGTFSVYLKDTSSAKKLWGLEGDQGEGWKNAKVDISSPSSYQVNHQILENGTCEATRAVWDKMPFSLHNTNFSKACGRREECRGYRDEKPP